MRRRRSIAIAIACALLCVLGAGLVVFGKGSASSPVSLAFHGYEGDFAVFSITNNDLCDVSFGSWSIMYDAEWSEGPAPCSLSGFRLKRGASCAMKVRVRFSSAGWRVRAPMQRHTPRHWLSEKLCGGSFHAIGIRLMEPTPYLMSAHITR